MKKEKIEIVYMPIGNLKPYPNNPRLNDAAVDFVARSIDRYGFRAPICVDKDNVIIYGHTRLRAAMKLGLKEVPVYRAVDMTPEQVAEYRLADNSVGEVAVWDKMKLQEEFAGLPNFSPIDFGFFGFKQPEKSLVLEQMGDEIEPLEGVNEGKGDVALLNDDPYKDNITDLGIPVVDITKVPTWDEVKDLKLFIADPEAKPPFLYIWGSGKRPDTDTRDIFEDSCLCFYTEDEKFNGLYPYPAEVTTRLLNAKVKMAIMPNFSSYPRMAKVERLFQIYKSHFVARYFQKNGLLVIPDFMPQGDIWEYTKHLIPHGCPFAVQLHQRFGSTTELKEWANVIKKQIDYCKPPYVIVYYSPKNRADFEIIFEGVQVLWVKTFAAQRMELRKSRKNTQK